MQRIRIIITALFLLALTGTANAVEIQGTIAIGGTTQIYYDSSTGKSTGLNWGCATCGGFVNTYYPAPTGDFATLGGLDTGNTGGLALYSFYYSGLPQTIWQVTHNGLIYSFTLATVTVTSGDTLSDNFKNLVLNGTGYFTITDLNGNYVGYDKTFGTWTFSNSAISFSSASIASPVTEPETIALLGLGLLGIGAAGRLRRRG